MNEPIVYYSQNKEDLILASIFENNKTGFYVDVGANHPTYGSVTKFFYEKGWKGINIEPIKSFYSLLQVDRPRDININCGVSNVEDSLNLREYKSEAGEGMSTFSNVLKKEYTANKHWATSKFSDYKVKVQRLSEIFNKNNVQAIDFMKVDVEGFEYRVLDSNDWKKYRPKVICIESNHIIEDWRPILTSNSYQLFFSDGLNDYYFDRLALPNFSYSYSEAFLMRFPKTLSYQEYIKSFSAINKLTLTQKLLEIDSDQSTKKTHNYINESSPKENLRELIKSLDQKLIELSLIKRRIREIKSKKPTTETKITIQDAYLRDNSISKIKTFISIMYTSIRPLLVKVRFF